MALVFTIGHSTRPGEEFLEILQKHRIEALLDVRSIPRSRHNPQFNFEAIGPILSIAGIEYRNERALGGLRRAQPDSPNTALRSAGFRGYADHMASRQFQEALAALEEEAVLLRTAIMCAEAVPWNCHRSLISDALTFRGHRVLHITGLEGPVEHRVTESAVCVGTLVTYPASRQQTLF